MQLPPIWVPPLLSPRPSRPVAGGHDPNWRGKMADEITDILWGVGVFLVAFLLAVVILAR